MTSRHFDMYNESVIHHFLVKISTSGYGNPYTLEAPGRRPCCMGIIGEDCGHQSSIFGHVPRETFIFPSSKSQKSNFLKKLPDPSRSFLPIYHLITWIWVHQGLMA